MNLKELEHGLLGTGTAFRDDIHRGILLGPFGTQLRGNPMTSTRYWESVGEFCGVGAN
jgi:hypothetical protein